MQRYSCGNDGYGFECDGGLYVLYTDARTVEEELAIAKETILLLEGEVKVKCRDCNRHGAFEENVKLREELAEANDRANDFRLMLNEKTAQLEDVKRAYQKVEEELAAVKVNLDMAVALQRQVDEERDRLDRRDGNATVQLCVETSENPFYRIDLKIMDFGVADNCYVVGSDEIGKVFNELERLRRYYNSTMSKESARERQIATLTAELAELKNTKCPLLDGVCFDLYEKDASISRLTAELAGMKEALEFCSTTLAKYHPDMNPDEPCIFYEMRKIIQKALGKEAT